MDPVRPAAAGVDEEEGADVVGGAGVVDVDAGCLEDESGERFGSSDGVDMHDPMAKGRVEGRGGGRGVKRW